MGGQGHAGLAVSAAYIKKLIDEKASFMLIDARPKRKFEQGAIPGAVNIPDTAFDKEAGKLPADKTTPLIIYCGGLECVLSDNLAGKVKALGYSNVKTFPEGYPEWVRLYGAEAKPAVLIEPGKEKGTMSAASFERIMKDSPDAIMVVDVRDKKEFDKGSIKGAVNIPISQLEKQVESLPKDKPIVFLCGTGARAGEAYDTAKLLRSELQVYFLDADVKFSGEGGFTVKSH